ncbi:SusE domain-containing protein [Lacinutrix sp. C3R15]|uniref:SusE domain-containing protein n=1 Tax=Flavobacteriaceae TaxID=49546 RepID=UPI001C0A0342|nr:MULTISPECIES: SusE domain-containing protein [Flavobacteriaceae]MBU2939107.1 SusE domain-containing protein [Lacinutrix sp. C3R15]MDO6622422.1 SusE domain-containing protein [Oceanihabitans sp. 1_MG-2023]
MKNILYKSILFLCVTSLFISCDDTETVVLNSTSIPEVTLSESTVVLNETNADLDALTVTWSEPDYGFDAAPDAYKVLIDTIDGDFSSAESVTAAMPFEKTFTVQELNTPLIGLELAPNEESQVQIKVEIVLSPFKSIYSEAVTLNVTPYPALSDLSSPWGIVGSATPNAWDGPDVPLYKTDVEGVFSGYVYLLDGLIKFRENNDWTVNYGDDGANNTLEGGGADIPVTAGTYYATLNLNTLEYTLETTTDDIWGLVGDATPNGWDGTDWPMYPAGNDIYVSYVTLIDGGQLKFRLNNDWANNYGDSGADGTLDNGGDNIIITNTSTGNYKITMDLFNQTYILEELN